jgi:pilus assembly protein CpaE
MSDGSNIKILLVDDIPETRESIKKLLAFEPDFTVVGTASNGREGVEQAKQLRPDIVIMDINMPDMDGLEAAGLITKAVPATGVIMMSVQNDADYMRRAMLAGARNFLAKPVQMDELYSTIRNVYQQYESIRRQLELMKNQTYLVQESTTKESEGARAGHLIVVYSPQGGCGRTTIATNLASALMKEGIKVLLVDASIQFGDVSAFLNIQSQSTLIDLVESVDDLDTDLFDNIVATHDSGLKVLVAPHRPEQAELVKTNPGSVGKIVDAIRGNYDFVVVDTATSFDDVLLPILDKATRIVLVVTPTLPAMKNIRSVLELFDQLEYQKSKIILTLNRATDPGKKGAGLSAERIQAWLKHPVKVQFPVVDERYLLSAVNKGVPIIAAERDHNKPPVKQILELADLLYRDLMGEAEEEQPDSRKESRSPFRFGR